MSGTQTCLLVLVIVCALRLFGNEAADDDGNQRFGNDDGNGLSSENLAM